VSEEIFSHSHNCVRVIECVCVCVCVCECVCVCARVFMSVYQEQKSLDAIRAAIFSATPDKNKNAEYGYPEMYCPETKEVVRLRKRDLCDMWCAYTNTKTLRLDCCVCVLDVTHAYRCPVYKYLYTDSLLILSRPFFCLVKFCNLFLLNFLSSLPLLLVRQYLCRWCSKHMLSLKMTRFAIPTVHFISLSLFRSRARSLRLVHGSLSLDLSAHSSAAAFVLKELVEKLVLKDASPFKTNSCEFGGLDTPSLLSEHLIPFSLLEQHHKNFAYLSRSRVSR
jgi:hypothetical protein